MGKEHWAKHQAKPKPVKVTTLDLAPNLVLVVRERPQETNPDLRFVATVRYVRATVKGKWVVTYHYGPTAAIAEQKVRALL